jgi:hypothetical protein
MDVPAPMHHERLIRQTQNEATKANGGKR